MGNINSHPAPGLGALPPGWTVRPSGNAMVEATTPSRSGMVASASAASGYRPYQIPRAATTVARSFIAPVNPLYEQLNKFGPSDSPRFLPNYSLLPAGSYSTLDGLYGPVQFPVPQNPVLNGQGMSGLFSPVQFPVPQNPVLNGQGMSGLFAPTTFPVPQNPILNGQGMSGLGCGCGGGCSSCGSTPISSGMQGLGDPVSDAIATWASAPSPFSVLGNAAFWGALVLAGGYFLMSHKHKL